VHSSLQVIGWPSATALDYEYDDGYDYSDYEYETQKAIDARDDPECKFI